MTVGLLVRLEVKPGKEADVENFLMKPERSNTGLFCEYVEIVLRTS